MSASPSVTRKRGRPAAESPQDRLARLEKELAAARTAVREAELRKFTVLGEAVAAEADANPQFKAALSEILTRRCTSAQARADIAPFLLAVAGGTGTASA